MADPQLSELLKEIKELRSEVQNTRRWVVFLAVLASLIFLSPVLAKMPPGFQILLFAAGFLWLATLVLGSRNNAQDSE